MTISVQEWVGGTIDMLDYIMIIINVPDEGPFGPKRRRTMFTIIQFQINFSIIISQLLLSLLVFFDRSHRLV